MKYILLLFLLVSCAQTNGSKQVDSRCPETSKEMENRHVIISAKSQTGPLGRCFRDFLKFEENKKQSFKVCSAINVNKSGRVTYTKVFGLDKRIPKDFQMCLEQEYWMMNFSKLQLDKPAYVKFPLEFKSK